MSDEAEDVYNGAFTTACRKETTTFTAWVSSKENIVIKLWTSVDPSSFGDCMVIYCMVVRFLTVAAW